MPGEEYVSSSLQGLVGRFLRDQGAFGVVTANEEGVRVVQNGVEHRFEWGDVKSFRQLPVVNPTIYRMTFEDSQLVTYFVPQHSTRFTFLPWTLDTSGMGGFIRKQLRAQGIA